MEGSSDLALLEGSITTPIGTTTTANLLSATDANTHIVDLPAAGALKVYFDTDATSGRWYISLTDTAGNTFWTESYSRPSTGSSKVLLRTTGLAAGRYYVKVSAYNGYSFSAQPYRLTPELDSSAAWEQEWNDDAARATAASASAPFWGSLYSAADVDWYAVTLDRPSALGISMFAESREGRYNVELYDAASGRFWSVDYQRPSTGEAEVLLRTTGLAAGRYYVKVSAYNGYSFSAQPYRLTPELDSSAAWEQEWNDDAARATALPLNAPMNGSLQTSGDADWYKIALPAAGMLSVSFAAPNATSGRWDIHLYRDTDTLLWNTAFTAASSEHVAKSLVLEPGTYYLRVRPYNGSSYSHTTATYQIAALAYAYSDVNPNGWYASSVNHVSYAKLMVGYPSGKFGVGNVLTRGQMATILWRYGQPDAAEAYQGTAANLTGMRDVVANRYYTAAANWAVENGVITGLAQNDGSRLFAPNAPVTFEQFVTILANYVDKSGAAATSTSGLSKFKDGSKTSSWATPSMAWAVSEGVVSGNTDGTLKPKQAVARERAATVLANALDEGLL